MVMFPCPWCEHDVPLSGPAGPEAQARCADCATVVDLAPLPTGEPDTALPLAA